MKLISRIKSYRWCLRSILSSIYFNFHYLPFSQAWKLPILLYKPTFRALKGSIEIVGGVKPGMIQLGRNKVSIYPNSGIMLELRGRIIFKGRCSIGNNSYISTSEKSEVIFGDDFISSTTLRLVCYDKIEFGRRVLVGWDCMFTDTDFHKITREDGTASKGYGPIIIGDDTWIANGCRFLKYTTLPNKTIVVSCSIVCGNINAPEKSIIGSQPNVSVLANGRWLNRSDDKIIYD